MPPLTVENFAPSGKSARPIATSTDPLTVFAIAPPVVETLTDPFTEWASASPLSDSAVTSPFTVLPMNRTPAGTLTSNRTTVSLLFVFERFFGPGSQVFGSRPGEVGYTAHTRMPPAWGTTSTCTSDGSLRFADFTARTSASPEPETVALISPLTPRTSSVCPDAIWPRQLKSACASARDAPHATRTADRNARIEPSAALRREGAANRCRGALPHRRLGRCARALSGHLRFSLSEER